MRLKHQEVIMKFFINSYLNVINIFISKLIYNLNMNGLKSRVLFLMGKGRNTEIVSKFYIKPL